MRKTLALDANVIVLLAVGLTDEKFIARHKRLHPTYRIEHLNFLLEIMSRFPAVAATTHALTEASNLVRQCAEPMRTDVTLTLGRLIKTSEELTPTAALAAQTLEFPRLGLTDAAFTQLDPQRYRVLSANLDLIVALERRGFEVTNFHQLIFD